jgi:hypothetical protein
MVLPDGTKHLYFDRFQLCTFSQEYFGLVPAEVQSMVVSLVASDPSIEDLINENSLGKAVMEDQTERELRFRPVTQQSTLASSTAHI